MSQYQVSFGDAIKRGFQNYCLFNGRASRSEYWFFVLFTVAVGAVISLILGTQTLGTVVSGLFNLAVLLPSLGLIWRRLHDTGRAGGWFFITLIPLVGIIILIVWLCQPSQTTENRFGQVPNTTL